MGKSRDEEFRAALEARGRALTDGIAFILADALAIDQLTCSLIDAQITEPGERPRGLPGRGGLLIHRGQLAPPRDASFALGWLFGDELTGLLTAPSTERAADERLSALANELADQLATDTYTLQSSSGAPSHDLFRDYLAAELPPRLAWLHFRVEGALPEPLDLYLAHPWPVIEQMYGIASGELATSLGNPTEPEPTAPEASPRAPAPTPIEESPATPPSTAGVRRALRVKVPVIVTLAMQNIETNKLLSIGPGAIIEFERAYNEPLQLSVNNVPIAMGEAVKVGDHFGLKITAILTPEERKKYFGGKWMY